MIPIIYDPAVVLPMLAVGIPAAIIAVIWKHFKSSKS